METIIYHYTSLDVLKIILETQKLRFTKMNSLNDRSEYKHGIQLLMDKIKQYEDSNNVVNKFNMELLNKFSFSDKLYSVSFTENGDDLAFWNSYYVDKTTPVSIGFIREKVFTNNDFIINRCIYGDPYPIMGKERYFWFAEIFKVKNILKLAKNREYIQITFQTAHIKNKAFEIEKEWRAVSFKSKSGVCGEFERSGKKVEYFDQSFNIESIREIIVGPSKLQETNYQKALLLASKSQLNCVMKKSVIPFEL